MPLGLLGGVVLGVLGEVALVARLSDSRGSGRPLYDDEVVKFVFQFLQTFFAVIFYFCHDVLFLLSV